MSKLRACLGAGAMVLWLTSTALAAPAPGTTPFQGTVSLDCESNPEVIVVTNTGTAPFVVDAVDSLVDPSGDQSLERGFETDGDLGPGEDITYYSGSEAPAEGNTTLSDQVLFADGAGDGARLEVNSEGAGAVVEVTCEQGRVQFDNTTNGPGKMPNTGAGGGTDGFLAGALAVLGTVVVFGLFGRTAARER